MGIVVSFEGFTPAARFDLVPWTDVQVEEGPTSIGPWTLIDTLALVPDVDPANPATRNLTTTEGTAADQWYRLIWLDAALETSEPTTPIQNVSPTTGYATVEQLAQLLKVSATAREGDLRRVLVAAALEIDSELGRSEAWDFSVDPEAQELLIEVNLERAVEHWSQGLSPFGIVGLGAESGPILTARDSWERHARKLAPLKETFGIA